MVRSPTLPRNISSCSTSTLNVVLVTLQNVTLSPLTKLPARFFFTPRYLLGSSVSSLRRILLTDKSVASHTVIEEAGMQERAVMSNRR